MERLAAEQCAVLRRRGTADLSSSPSRWPSRWPVRWSATDGRGSNGPPAEPVLRQHPAGDVPRTPKALWGQLRNTSRWPRSMARRTAQRGVPAPQRRDDLISHLIARAAPCRDPRRCVTFAAAGMVTTREFITSRHGTCSPYDLRARYVTGARRNGWPSCTNCSPRAGGRQPVPMGNREHHRRRREHPGRREGRSSIAATNLDPSAVAPTRARSAGTRWPTESATRTLLRRRRTPLPGRVHRDPGDRHLPDRLSPCPACGCRRAAGAPPAEIASYELAGLRAW